MKCSVDFCEREARTTSFCGRHYAQIRMFGKIKKRTKFDPNEIIIDGDKACILTYDALGNEKGVQAIIDADDVEKVCKYKWCLVNGTRIATLLKTKKWLSLSHLIMDHKSCRQIQVDHINRNPLDNRKSNLRICKESENYRNRGVYSTNTSGYKGVSFRHQDNKWEAYIWLNYKKIGLGLFSTKEEARMVREAASKKIHGEFGNL